MAAYGGARNAQAVRSLRQRYVSYRCLFFYFKKTKYLLGVAFRRLWRRSRPSLQR